MDKKDTALLEAYMHDFFGYGNLNADIWLIGKEEAGESIEERLKAWEKLGKATVADNYIFHSELNETKLFDQKKPELQRTWIGLSKLLLAYENGEEVNKQNAVAYQAKSLGRLDSENCLLELFPLPSPSVKYHPYKDWDIDYLKSKKEYKKALKAHRIGKLKDLIQTHKPKAIVFYSSSQEYRTYWSDIMDNPGSAFESIKVGKVSAEFYKKDRTVFVIMPHPVAYDITNEFLVNVGKKLKTLVQAL